MDHPKVFRLRPSDLEVVFKSLSFLERALEAYPWREKHETDIESIRDLTKKLLNQMEDSR